MYYADNITKNGSISINIGFFCADKQI
ncbi:hypothetical protein ES1_18470 [[Eubacterium] siraeum V10Sc8a]|uniref:Uncharacterized protein n=1 Tax=[Eubacterium] siraeum V10Sc8a TaxID=717961 RepID=D4MLX1_9FIRM|nr:hypothetical protein ES1_18470 [[Eubacterium] siraeum V10Sc8a]